MAENLERQIIEIIAHDRIDIPISSMSGKLKRRKKKLAQTINLAGYDSKEGFSGERAYARVEEKDLLKARGMKEGIANFEKEFPRYGTILKGMIEEKRAKSETHLYFGMHISKRLTSDDYLNVMDDLGFTESKAKSMYSELMNASRKISKARIGEERSILVG